MIFAPLLGVPVWPESPGLSPHTYLVGFTGNIFPFLLRLAGLLLMAIWPAAAQALVDGRKDSSLSDMGDTECSSRVCTRAQRDAWQDTWALSWCQRLLAMGQGLNNSGGRFSDG